MLINLFKTLKEVGVPCTLRELLDLISGLEKQVIFADINDFYYLSRSILVKDEKHYDKFDRAFDIYFKGLETLDDVLQALVPEEWLRKEFEKLNSLKTLRVREGTPEDLTKAIQSFITQAIIIAEYDLDSMPTEYTENLLRTMAKYPEYNKMTLDLIEIINQKK